MSRLNGERGAVLNGRETAKLGAKTAAKRVHRNLWLSADEGV
jgi:hypothetical protein